MVNVSASNGSSSSTPNTKPGSNNQNNSNGGGNIPSASNPGALKEAIVNQLVLSWVNMKMYSPDPLKAKFDEMMDEQINM